MKRPFIFFTIPLILGIVFSYYINISTYVVSLLLFIFILIEIFKSNKLDILFLAILFFLLGIFLTNLNGDSSLLIKYTNFPVELKGKVIDIRDELENESKYILLISNLKTDELNIKTSEKIILKIIGEKKLELGDEIIFNCVLKEPLGNTNPKLFNYKLNLLAEKIFTTTTIKEYSIIQINKPKLNFGLNLKSKFTRRVENILDLNLSYKNASIMKSIILGKYSYLEEEDINAFRDLGLAHILAVSGLHIGIIAGTLFFIFSYFGIKKKVKIILTIGVLWTYAYIIGNPSSVIRANIMFSLLLISQIAHEPYDSLNTLAFSCFIILIVNPFLLFNLGFQLSYLASFFILYLGKKLNNIFSKTLSGIMAVQIGLFPIQAYYFNRIPLLSIIANLLFVPVFSLALILSIILVLLPFPYGYMGNSFGIIINLLLNIQFKAIEVFTYFPKLTLKIPSPSIIEIIFYYLILFIIFGSIKIYKLNKSTVKSIIIYLLLIILINTAIFNLNHSIAIEFIDVGQGDSILIKTLDGNYLIDTGGNIFGNFDIGENILLPYLEKSGIFKLKGVFISHFDVDHCKSLPYLIDNIEIKNIYFGYKRLGNIYYDEIVEKAKQKGIPITILKDGDRFNLDKNTSITVLGPKEELLKNPNNSENDLSLILMLNYFNKNILFTGDIEKLGEGSLIQNLNQLEFLKVPHHGSKTSSTEELLDIAKPREAFISVGRNNSFGHPHSEIIERYNNKGISLYRTDELGLINLVLNEKDYNINAFLKEKPDIIYILVYYKLWIIGFIFYNIFSYFLIKQFIFLDREMERIELQRIY